ncbi:hypothetical protein AVEN_35531-1 [Araneus ventricosus]|uniref:Uncharacterized protein n=1 Tax=Araneus ventricosus TaxID=182803 RepID=A0A4Y2NRT9_ARAVE|nr:hypothetical protein AVEN_35531-1 [Araneus ventricosus]
MDSPLSRPFTSQINWIFWNARREKPSKSMVINQMACGGWNSAWTEIGAKALEFIKSRFRGTLKEASEKNSALRKLKPRFKDSIN